MENATKLWQILLGISFLLAMFINGLVIIGMEINLPDFANICGVSLREASLALICRSVGSFFGAAVAGPILNLMGPNNCVCASVLFVGILLGIITSTTDIFWVFTIFGLMGMLACIIQAGALLLIRLNFIERTGSWLQAASFAFQTAVAIFPLCLTLMNLLGVYILSSAFTICSAFYGFIIHSLHKDKNHMQHKETSGSDAKKVMLGDIITACVMFFVSGIIVQTTTYLRPYIDTVKPSRSDNESLLLVALTTCILIGQIITVHFQISATTASVMRCFQILLMLGLCSQIAPLIFPDSAAVLWGAMVGFGLFWGPLPGLTFDLWDRYTLEPTSYGSAIVNFGTFCGSGFVSTGMYSLWLGLDYPGVLMCSNILGFLFAAFFAYSLNCIKRESRKTLLSEELRIADSGEVMPLISESR